MRWVAIAGIMIGTLLAVVAYRDLSGQHLAKTYMDPFALRQSGYGTMLARLGQNNLERAWHYGMMANEISQKRGGDKSAGGEDVKPGKGEVGHEGHNHEDKTASRGEIGGGALEFLVRLDAERFARTNKVPLSKALEKSIAADIEKLLLRSYNMDPTDYGVYDTYYHFLLYHQFRGTPKARKHAYQISENTIQVVFRDKLDPLPWLTAAAATVNQFFIHMYDYRRETGDESAVLSDDVLVKYRDRMRYCLAFYIKLRDQSIQTGRWKRVSEERVAEAEGRARMSFKMLEQFDAMIKRRAQETGKKEEAD